MDQLDELLDRSSPSTSAVTPEVASELQRVRAVTATIARGRHRRWLRPAGAALATTFLVGGIAAGAAATGAWTLPWAQDEPIAVFTYTLPSGIECEQRIGGVTGSVPEAVEATEDFYRTTDVQALLTDDAVQAVIARYRQEGGLIHINEDGTQVAGGYGTEFYDADAEYMRAVLDVVFTAMDEDLERRGMTGVDRDLSLQSEPNCPGLER